MIHYDTEKQNGRFWLKENEFCPRFELKTESVFAQCNGYMGKTAACSSAELLTGPMRMK